MKTATHYACQTSPNHPSQLQRKTYKVKEVSSLLGIGRTKIYELMKRGELQKIKIGASTLIAAESVDALLLRHASRGC